MLDVPLNKLYKKIEKLMRPHPFLDGATTCFGVMPDWNPAEILGIRPKKLAISLYKELITDNIWAHQRNDYGYRDLTLHPLMVSFCGIPYIDVRVSFNSFVPKGIKTELSKKLVDYYISKFKEFPKLHDKVEFEIVFSCYYFGISDDLNKLIEYGFTENETKRIEYALLTLTNEIIKPSGSVFNKDIDRAEELIKRHNIVVNSSISDVDKIYWLIENCKQYGTLPFAGVARGAFIAMQFLKSFVKRQIISSVEYDEFINSLHTVSKNLKDDIKKFHCKEMTEAEVLKKYGHIRPNTYDITSPRYDEAFEWYFGGGQDDDFFDDSKFEFSDKQKAQIQYELDQNGLLISTDELIKFIRNAIHARESVKFIFTRSVSEILSIIKRIGNRMGIDVGEMAHLDISVIKSLYSDLYYNNLSEVLLQNIELNKRQYDCATSLKLPCVISKPEDVYSFFITEDEPNFITQKVVQAESVHETDLLGRELQNKIVFIESADPGYDFLFTKQISGLITMYGGANSHMAIRCAENGIPAVIGAGEKNYSLWNQYKKIRLDCLNQKVSCVV
jgi:phosphohistidine swiveling domain-containing protein